jgi:uncharacterized protein (DUF1786 family)
MQVLTVDIGTGTQDIYLFRTGFSLENGYKLIMPSPTMIIQKKIQDATRHGKPILLTGVTMGGGPCHWAAEDHLRAGYKLFATPEAAQTFNDDLDWVRHEMGVEVISEDEAARLDQAQRIELSDFDFHAIAGSFAAFGVRLNPSAVAIAVFDHGAAPPNISDRQFRFEYLEARISAEKRLSAFAHISSNIPSFMTRMQAVAKSASTLNCPIVVMDTAPASVLGATLDPQVANRPRVLILNLGNFHTLAFRLGPTGIEGVFEHHTGLIDLPKLEALIQAFTAGSLTHQQIFTDHGHGSLILFPEPLRLPKDDFGIAVTGPRRNMMKGSLLRPYFAVPYGDMMLVGCFGLLIALADHVHELADPICSALADEGADTAPWNSER